MIVLVALAGWAASLALRSGGGLRALGAPWTRSPRERYEEALAEAGLAATELGLAWSEAGRRALERPIEVGAPYRETVFFDPGEPSAAGFRLELRRGQRLAVSVEAETGTPDRFLDLYEIPATPDAEPRLLDWARDEGAGESTADLSLDHEVRRDGAFLVRLQPGLLVGGRFVLTLEAKPTLTFPVRGQDSSAIGSRFGDRRDGGRRRHLGVDIFATRGAPAVAAADARVSWVGPNRLGGNTVWLVAEELGLTFYYAHLERAVVRVGQRVRAGETVGRVGNTGNARSTPPHLHFAVLDSAAAGGTALDPWPFLHRFPEPADLEVDPARLGGWARVLRDGARLRAAPGTGGGRSTELARWTPVEIRAGCGGWLRVDLADGRRGFVAASLTEPAREPLRRSRLDVPRLLRSRPSPGSPAVAELLVGEEIGVLAETPGAVYVEAPTGRRGWIREPRQGRLSSLEAVP